MKKIFIPFTILLVLSTSGCTVPFLNIEIPFLPDIFPGMQTMEQRHDVISIESLQVIPSVTVREGQSIRLRAVVKNLQEPEYEPIKGVVIGLYNDCGMFDTSVEFCQTEEKGKSDEMGMYYCKLDRMYPQSTAIVEWKLVAKPLNVETSCRVGTLAQYDHTTYSTGSVTFVNKAELERIVSEGRGFSETGIATIGEGPVKPYIEILNQPIIIDTTQGVQDPGSGIMSFWIENKGQGILDISESSAEEGNVVFGCENFQTTAPSTTDKMCIEIDGGERQNPEHYVTAIKEEDNQKKNIKIQECVAEHLKTPKDKYSASFIKRSTPKYSCSITVTKTG
jgi:hypothetical protein